MTLKPRRSVRGRGGGSALSLFTKNALKPSFEGTEIFSIEKWSQK